ncbi:MAG: hypothetical protein JF602_09890, partial [Gemmatimonadetes bacterium]|nr:hypothetical protein [Gemmatimonadota bacterium]
ITRGNEVTLGRLGPRGSVVEPPADPAALGALNRALAARGLTWRYGALTLAPTNTDSGSAVGRVRVLRRYRFESTASGRTGVLATAGGEPWLVRSGDVVLLGSRLNPDWTISANLDPRETLLRPVPDEQVRRLWRRAQVVSLPDAAGLAFASGALGDLRGPFLWLAAALGLGQMALATGRRRER